MTTADARSRHAHEAAAPIRIEGHCDPAFRAVEDAFAENFRSRDEIGAGLCVRIAGRAVVDLWGGHCDADRRRPWQRDTLVNAYSVGKGVTAMLVLSLVERGELDLEAPIDVLWPEFATHDKGATTLRMLLSHQAGLPGIRHRLEPDAMLDWSTMTTALAETEPYWPPGTAHGYHVNTHGFLVGEPLVRRLGVPFATALHERLTGPHGIDFWIGLASREHPRVASIVTPARSEVVDPRATAREHFGSGDDATDAMLANVYFNPIGLSGAGYVNRPDWRRASIPSTNGHGTARAVAALYELFMVRDASQDGIVGPGLRREATSIVVDGPDRVLGKPSRFGLGFQLSQPTRPIGLGERGFGHFGYGGTLGFADPESGVAFGYLMNRPGERWQTPRTNALVEALYEALGDRDRVRDPARVGHEGG